ncbi:phosphate ABC transporter permease PstA [Sphingomonas bacterium]|uniref:phosphate ABC transporter permease PstA n=1 Tax=Sphingomonas bacterium TaxID=1895847 RepID=UPI0015764E15|nr:phosphate ABC transporter permease PstA [Sphingomonas bacterium]
MTARSARATRRRIINAVFVAACGAAALVALIVLAAILWSLVARGLGGLTPALFVRDTPGPGEPGGLRNAILGSLMLCGLGMALALVVGILAGTWLAEYGGRTPLGHGVRLLNDVLLSAPSILIGLFVYEALVAHVVGRFSALAGAVALAIIALPVVTRTTEDMLALQPAALREAGMALGATRALVTRRIVWRSALAGLVTAALLAFARISGETAPLLFTSLGNQFLSFSPSQPIASLPTVIFQFALSGYDDWRQLAWTGALLIAAAVLAISVAGRLVTRGARRP